MKRFIVTAIGVIISLGLNGQIINKNTGFESGDFEPQWRRNDSSDPRSIIEVVQGNTSGHPTARNGNYMLHCEHDLSYRAEIVNADPDLIQHFQWNEDHWLGASVYLDDWNTNPVNWHTLIQMHTVVGNWNWNECCSGDNGFTVHTNWDGNTQWLNVHAKTLSNPMTEIPTCAAVGGSQWRIPVPENQWLDFVFNFRLSTSNDGFIKVWYNGNLIIDITGPNVHYLDDCGVPREPYCDLAVGTYKERANTTRKSIYADEIKIGGPSSRYEDVAPGGGAPSNYPPVLASIGNKTLTEEEVLNVQLSATDADGDALSYSISPSIGFITLTDNQNGTGTLRLSPLTGNAGNYNITVTVTDSNNTSDSETITIVVNRNNTAPVLSSIGNQSITEGDVLDIQLSSTDAQGDAMSYSVTPSLPFANFTDNQNGTGLIRLTPVYGNAGTYNLTVTVTDSYNASDSETITIIVNNGPPPNSAPVLASIGNQTILEDDILDVQLSSTDADGDAISYSLSPDIGFVTLTDNQDGSASLNISPVAGDAGTYSLSITVTDVNNAIDSEDIVIIVNSNTPSNTPPILGVAGNQSLTEGEVLNLQLSATDADGDALSYSVSPSIGFVQLTDNQNGTAVLNISPIIGDAGNYNLTLIVTDANNASDSEVITIEVISAPPPNSPPVLASIGNQTVSEGNVRNLQLSSSDVEGDILSYSISPNIDFITLSDNQDGTALIQIAPLTGDVGTYTVTVIVTDSNNASDSETITINVNEYTPPSPPVLAYIGNQRVAEGEVLNIPVSANDANGDVLSFSYSPLIGFISLTDNQNGTGTLTIAPIAGQAGINVITVTVSDGNGGSDSESISIIVDRIVNGNAIPIMNRIEDQRIEVGQVLNVQLFSSDAEGDAMTYSMSPELDFITFNDQSNGNCTMIIAAQSGDGGIYDIAITVTDENNGSMYRTFTLTVDETSQGNLPPALTYIGDQIVNLGSTANLQLYASDPNGDALSYSLSPNLGFITLNDNGDGTGRIIISPSSSDVGSHALTISVTDVHNASDTETITIIIDNGEQQNLPPVLQPIGDIEIEINDVLNLPIYANDIDEDQLQFTISPNDMTFLSLIDNQNGTGILRISPTINDVGQYTINVVVRDEYGQYDSETLNLTIFIEENGNILPILSPISDQLVNVGETVEVLIKSYDLNNDELNYSLTPQLDFVQLHDNLDGSATLTFSPLAGDAGKYSQTITVTDSNNGNDAISYNIIVTSDMNSGYVNIINSGGTSIAYGSALAQEDKYFNGGNTATRNENYKIDDTENGALYRSVRYGEFNYEIPVPANGVYTVRLHFAEVTFRDGALGKRIFNVDIENGKERLINYDINADVGPNTAVIKTYTSVDVEDGYLSIRLNTVIQNAIISGVEVISETDKITHLEIDNLHKKISIYPNPSNGIFTIENLSEDQVFIDLPYVIYDISGKIIFNSKMTGSREVINLAGERKGMYILKIGDFTIEKIFIH